MLGILLMMPAASFSQAYKYQYVIKFVCGAESATDGRVAPGRYYTAINIRAGSDSSYCRENISIGQPGRVSGPVTGYIQYFVRPQTSVEIDCKDIARRCTILLPNFIKGFVTIDCTSELDVVAVYTASGPTGRVETIDVERISPRMLGR